MRCHTQRLSQGPSPWLLVTSEKVSRHQLVHYVPLAMPCAEDVEGEALVTLVVNTVRGSVQCIAVKASGFGERRKEMVRDIAVLTRGQVISEDVGVKLAAGQRCLRHDLV